MSQPLTIFLKTPGDLIVIMSTNGGPKGPKSKGSKASDKISIMPPPLVHGTADLCPPADSRFANIQSDPRFRLPSKKNSHVQIDKRFAPMLQDEAFSSRAKVDRYGRKLPKSSGRKDLERYYKIEPSKESGDEDDDIQRELERVNADDEAEIESSSDSSSSDGGNDLHDAEETEVFGMLENEGGEGQGIPKGEVSSRLAVVNLDWDNIRAADLMAVFSSFVPGHGRISKVAVYPSEFGKERMEKEEMEGPPKEIFKQASEEGEDHDADSESASDEREGLEEDDDDEGIKKSILKEDSGQEFNSARLRRYQLERLRYYYAVLTCSSTEVSQTIYDSVDGTEYLTTANFFDLRYIPDETDFSDDRPRDECTRIPDGYRPNEFVTDALQHSKVKLTWDADDGMRKDAQKRAFSGSRKDLDENDLKAYLGSDSSEEEAELEPVVVDSTSILAAVDGANDIIQEHAAKPTSKKEAERLRMRALLGLGQDSAPRRSKTDKAGTVGDMQVTFTSGLSADPDSKGSVFENEPPREETTVEKYVRKEKERKARRKEKMKNKGDNAEGGIRDENGNDDDDDDGDDNRIRARAEANDMSDPDNLSTDAALAAPPNDTTADDGFNDPFFTGTPAAPPTASKRKEEKRQKRERRAAEEAASAAERSKLEAIMNPAIDTDTANAEPAMTHFDINALARAEKVAAKRAKSRGKAKLSARDREALEAKGQDDFKMDVDDDRFKEVFERAEFAIDPSHPRFKGTGGMKALLEESRRKRTMKAESGDGAGPKEEKKRRLDREGEDDVEALVRKVKKKSRMVGSSV